MQLCMVSGIEVGVCGYSTAPDGCPRTTLDNFCASNPTAKTYNGGLAGSPTGYFGYYVSVTLSTASMPAASWLCTVQRIGHIMHIS
jgi:hypothetical protein